MRRNESGEKVGGGGERAEERGKGRGKMRKIV